MTDEVKDAQDRSHMWERPTRADERPQPQVNRRFPMHLYKRHGDQVHTIEVMAVADYDEMRTEGWSEDPNVKADPGPSR